MKARKLPPFELYTAAQLLELPDPEWLIEGVLPEQSLASLFGNAGTGKSFVGLDWALHVAHGLPWQGRAVKQGLVVYVASEGGAGIKKRVRAWHEFHELEPQELFFVLLESMNMRSSEDIRRLVAAVEAKPVRLIVIDTLNRSLPGGDENSPKDMSLLIDNATKLQRELRATVLFIHHTGHSAKGRSRGHSSFFCALDCELQLKKNASKLLLACRKLKDWEQTLQLELWLRKANGSLVVVPSTELTIEERVRAFLLQQPGSTMNTVQKNVEGKATAVREAVLRLIEAEKVENDGDGRQMALRCSETPGINDELDLE